MEQKQRSTIGDILITAAIGTVLLYVFSSIVGSILNTVLAGGIQFTRTIVMFVLPAVTALFNLIGMVCACLFFSGAIARAKANVGGAFVAGLAAAAILFIIPRVLMIAGMPANNLLINLTLKFVAAFVGGLIYVSMSKPVVSPFQASGAAYQAPGTAYQAPGTAYQAPGTAYQAPGTAPQAPIAPEDMEQLSGALLAAIRPSLKSPLTAVLCTPQEMRFLPVSGGYRVEGYVNSQNSYGAMIATDFSAVVSNMNGVWVVTNVKVGVKNAQNFTKSFVSNYIAISVLVGVLGILGYFILTMIIG